MSLSDHWQLWRSYKLWYNNTSTAFWDSGKENATINVTWHLCCSFARRHVVDSKASWKEVELVGHQTTRHIWLRLNAVHRQKCTMQDWIMDRVGSLDCQGPPIPQDVWPETAKQSCLTTKGLPWSGKYQWPDVQSWQRFVHTKKVYIWIKPSVNILIQNISSEYMA